MEYPRLSPLERSILASLAYFDVFDYPLRVEELWRWLYATEADSQAVAAASPADVEQALASGRLAQFIERAGSYVSLAGRSGIVATRMERRALSERKWQRARRVVSLLRTVPFVQFVGVVNTLAIDNARPESDIDFFIIVRRRRLWLTRLMVTAFAHLLGVRRHGRRVANRVCLSFFVSDAKLNLEPLSIDAGDPYLTYWITQVAPMFEREGVWRRFRDHNHWVTRYLPHGFAGSPGPRQTETFLVHTLRWLPELVLSSPLGRLFELIARWLQLKHMRRKTGSPRLAGMTDVVVNDEILKFHERDRRREYREAFHARLASFQLTLTG